MKKPKTIYRRMHGGQHRGRKRDPFYGSVRWLKIRKEVIATQPICADPFSGHREFGEVVASTEVDHIIPRSINRSLELALWNLQGLCKSCHSKKTRSEQGV